MVKHVVMWRLHENSPQNRLQIKDLLHSLAGRIDGLETLETGENISPVEPAYDLVLITTHTSREALEKYRKHPEHVAVAERIKKITRERAVVDFEC